MREETIPRVNFCGPLNKYLHSPQLNTNTIVKKYFRRKIKSTVNMVYFTGICSAAGLELGPDTREAGARDGR